MALSNYVFTSFLCFYLSRNIVCPQMQQACLAIHSLFLKTLVQAVSCFCDLRNNMYTQS